MKNIKKIAKIFIGLFVSIGLIFLLIKRILKIRSKQDHDEEDSEPVENLLSKLEGKLSSNKKNKSKSSVKKSGSSNDASKSDLLSSRQKKIMNLFEDKGELEMDDITEKIRGVHVRTIRRDLNKLADLKLIEKKGSTKGTSYKVK